MPAPESAPQELGMTALPTFGRENQQQQSMSTEHSKSLLSPQGRPADDDDFAYVSNRLGSSSYNNTVAADPPPTDAAWGLAFKINVAITLVSALYFGGSWLHALNSGVFFMGDGRRHLSTSGEHGGGAFGPAFFFVGVVSIGWAFAWGVLSAVINFSKEILQVAYLGVAGISGMAAVSALVTRHWLAWTIPAILCVWSVRFFSKRQPQIRFSSANLKVAAVAVKSMPWTFRTALLMSGVQVLWVLVCAVAAGGSIASARTMTGPDGTVYPSSICGNVSLTDTGSLSCQCGGKTILYSSTCQFEGNTVWLACFWLASLGWGAAVIRGVVTATVAGSVASWWFSPGGVSPVRGALYRATHGSFGSICKAAALTTAVRIFARAMRRLTRACRYCNFLLEWLQVALDYVLAYTICFISIYGLSFSEAGRRVSELFRKRGVTTVANDVIVDAGLAALVLGATVCYVAVASALGQVVVKLSGSSSGGGFLVQETVAMVVVSYLLVTVIVGTTVEVLRSAFKAVFLCFVQDPEALATNHDRQIYNELSVAWREMQAWCPGMAVVIDDTDKDGGIQEV
ncbi:unnamed protein product [Pylaiella littoralis]